MKTYKKRRDLAIKLLGGKCVWCGSTSRLVFDHIDRKKRNTIFKHYFNLVKNDLMRKLKNVNYFMFLVAEKKLLLKLENQLRRELTELYRHIVIVIVKSVVMVDGKELKSFEKLN